MLEILLAASISASDFKVEVESARFDRGSAKAVFKLTNNTAKSYQRVFVNCVFFAKDGTAAGIGRAIVRNVAPASSQFEDAGVVLDRNSPPSGVQCSVSQVTE